MNKIDLTKTAQIIFFVLVLPALSVMLVLGLVAALEPLKDSWYYPFVDGLGFIGAYVLLFTFFDRIGWRFRFFRWLKVVSVPYLGGRWKGYLQTSHNKRSKKIPAILEIDQTFGTIKTCLYTELSFSSSLMADFVKAPSGRTELHYEYHNEPNEKSTETMHGHDGVARLTFESKRKDLTGSYYTTSQHDRGNIGSLYFEFESHKTCACFNNN
jgi:hypothetical protein